MRRAAIVVPLAAPCETRGEIHLVAASRSTATESGEALGTPVHRGAGDDSGDDPHESAYDSSMRGAVGGYRQETWSSPVVVRMAIRR
jgi:hypothetical protein